MESNIGGKIRAARRSHHVSQVDLARRLGISPSYLNLIEHNRRAAPAELLLKLAASLPLDLTSWAVEHDERRAAELIEALGDPLLDHHDVPAGELREIARSHPQAAEAIVRLHSAYRGARESLQYLATRMAEEGAQESAPPSRLPADEVSDLLQRHLNYFPDLEADAERLVNEAGITGADGIFPGLTAYLQRAHGVTVRVERTSRMHGALRRFDVASRVLCLSEALGQESRNFQLAHQAGLLGARATIARLTDDPMLTSDESRSVCRVVLANYVAMAIVMPYEAFLAAARAERYDIDVLGHRFHTSFEQTCHRLTTLRRPGATGVPFHMIRVDVAGNISKRFSASGMRFARLGGACPRWNVFRAFLTPGTIRTNVVQMPDGRAYFDIARTVSREGGGFHAPRTQYAIAIGCAIEHAHDLVYAVGRDLASRDALVPIGPSCRMCDRLDCEQRAFPPLQHALRVNEDVRGVSFYAPVSS
jgi:predicted transcriptional regulator/transcriptional regulator with XRE-family HTH domain